MFVNHLKTRSKPNPIDTLIPNSLNSKLGCLMVFSKHERMRRVAKGILNFEVFMRIVAAAASFFTRACEQDSKPCAGIHPDILITNDIVVLTFCTKQQSSALKPQAVKCKLKRIESTYSYIHTLAVLMPAISTSAARWIKLTKPSKHSGCLPTYPPIYPQT